MEGELVQRSVGKGVGAAGTSRAVVAVGPPVDVAEVEHAAAFERAESD